MELPYYTTNSKKTFLGKNIEPENNYDKGELFCLKTKLYPFVHKKFGIDKEVSFSSVNKDSLSIIKLIILDGNRELKLKQDQIFLLESEVRNILSKTPKTHALIMKNDSCIYTEQGKKIPSSWIAKMISYVSLKDKYELYQTSDGLLATIIPKIYKKYKKQGSGRPRLMLTFNVLFKILIEKITKKLREMYLTGWIYDPPKEIIKNWELDSISTDGKVYSPNWKNEIITDYYGGLQEFLTSRMRKEKEIYIKIGRQNAKRHIVAHFFNKINLKCMFIGDYVITFLTNIKQVNQINNIIENLIQQANTNVVVFRTENEKRVLIQGNTISYIVLDDFEVPIAVSGALGMTESSYNVMSSNEVYTSKEYTKLNDPLRSILPTENKKEELEYLLLDFKKQELNFSLLQLQNNKVLLKL